MKLDWSAARPSPYEDIEGHLGAWTLRRLTSGQAQASFAAAGKHTFQGRAFAIYGSMAEARLAVAAYEACAAEPQSEAEQLLAAGFEEKPLRGEDDGSRRYAKPSGPGELVLVIREDPQNGGSLSLSYHPKRGARWSTIALVFGGRADQSGPISRPALSGDPFAKDLMVALQVAEARLRARGDQARPLADGQECPLIEEVASAADTAPSGPRP